MDRNLLDDNIRIEKLTVTSRIIVGILSVSLCFSQILKFFESAIAMRQSEKNAICCSTTIANFFGSSFM